MLRSRPDTEETDTSLSKRVKTGPPMSLLDWPKAWILEALRYVDCKSGVAFGRTAKYSTTIRTEIQDTSAGCQSAMSIKSDVTECIKQVVQSALSRLTPKPTLAFLFVSPSFKDAPLKDALSVLTKMLPPECQLSGCHGIGLMGRDELTGRMHEVDRGAKAISLLLLHSPEIEAKLTFLDVKTLSQQFNHRDPMASTPPTQANKEWLSQAIGVQDSNVTSSFILLTSPTRLVTPFLRCLHELVPHALITGALASGGKPKTIALFSRQPGQPVNNHTNGLVVMEISRRADRHTANSLKVPPLTGFASRGCKACSNVYQIVGVSAPNQTDEQSDVMCIEKVSLARTLQEDDASTAMLDEQMIRRLTGNAPSTANDNTSGQRNDTFLSLSAPVESTDDIGRMNVMLDMIDVVRQMIERQASQEEGDINGLFIGISDEINSKEGRILCDILEVQANGVNIDTSILQQEQTINQSGQSGVQPVSLVGKYMQFMQLDSRASCLDLANRVRTATRKNQLRQLIEQKARHSSKFANYASILPPRPIGGLLLSCAGRGQGFFQHPNIDSQIVEYQGGGLQIAGFASNGEIGPPARSLQVQRWIEEMNVAAEASLDQASSITHNLRNDTNEHKQNESSGGDDDDAGLITVASEAFVLPPTSIVSPAVLQSFTAVVTIFASQY